MPSSFLFYPQKIIGKSEVTLRNSEVFDHLYTFLCPIRLERASVIALSRLYRPI